MAVVVCARQQAFGATLLLQRCVLFRSIHPRGYAATFQPHSSTNHESYVAEFRGVCPDVIGCELFCDGEKTALVQNQGRFKSLLPIDYIAVRVDCKVVGMSGNRREH